MAHDPGFLLRSHDRQVANPVDARHDVNAQKNSTSITSFSPTFSHSLCTFLAVPVRVLHYK